MINFSLIIISFIAGFLLHKNLNKILNFIRVFKIFLQSYKKKDEVYNQFFECNFDRSEYSEEVDINDV